MVRPTSTLFSLNISPLAAVTLVLGSSLSLLPGTTARASHVGRGCNGEHLAKRNPYLFPEESSSSNAQLLKRQDAQGYSPDNLDPVSQCTGYSYQPVLDNKANFPTIWDTAQLVPGDQEAADLLAKAVAEVNRLAPNISVKGTLNGDFSSFTPTYPPSDPDCWWTYRQCDTPSNTEIPADVIEMPEPSTYGIGFDDGPNCSHNAFYQHLKDREIKATMFYIGSNVMNWPKQAQRGLSDGHQLAVHTWSHQYLTAMTNEQVFAELYYTQKAIKLVTGVTPVHFRPPFGDIDNRVRVIAKSLNLTSILWETDSDDWRINTGNPPVTSEQIDANYQSVLDAAKNGSYNTRGTIMLTHELNNFTMSEAIKFLPDLQGAFQHVITVAQGLNVTHPYVEQNVTAPAFDGSATTGNATSSSSASSSAASSAATGSSTATGSKAAASSAGAATDASKTGSNTAPASTASRASSSNDNKSNSASSSLMGPSAVSLVLVGAGIVLASL